MNNAIVVEDDKPTTRRLCKIVREAFGEIRITEAGTVQEARRALRNFYFGLALVDINLPDGSGIDLIREIAHIRPETKCIVMTICDDNAHIFDGLKAGADGYLLKEQPNTTLAHKLRGILSGEPPISPGVARRILEHFHVFSERAAARAPDLSNRPVILTNRETDVLKLVATGQSNREIADALAIKPLTVASHVRDIYRKLGISTRAEAALEARDRGLV